MWRERLNHALARTTGYELRRPERDQPAQPAYPSEQRAPAAPPSQSPAPPVPGRGGGQRGALPAHYDDDAKRIIHAVKPRTMTAHQKLYGLILATRYIAAHQIPGDIVGCGVWRGGSMQAVALTLLAAGVSDRDLHLFDTFQGMPETPTEVDRRSWGKGETAAELMAASDRDARVWGYAPFDDVRTAMDETEYPPELIHYHQGMVEDTIPELAPERIALLRLDTDWYESTRHELEHLYDRLVPGGVLIIDDYGSWEGSRLATEEFLAKTGAPLLLLPLKTGRIAVKPNF